MTKERLRELKVRYCTGMPDWGPPTVCQELIAEVERLRDALNRYGEHCPSCSATVSSDRACDCGLTELLKGDS